MHILITGASGYIGSVLVPKLINQGHQVTAIDRFFFGDSLPENENLIKIQSDARDFDPTLMVGKDAVIDLKNAFEKKLLFNTLDNPLYFNIKMMNKINLKKKPYEKN